MRILIAGIGNIFMGDDAFGCEVAGQMSKRELPEGVRAVDFGIRSYDLAFALMEDYDAAILVDAMPRGEQPGTLTLIEPDSGALERLAGEMPDAHSMNPLTSFRLVRTLGGEPPRYYVLGCEPMRLDAEDFELSPPVRAAVPGAIAMIEELVAQLIEIRDSGPARQIAAGAGEHTDLQTKSQTHDYDD